MCQALRDLFKEEIEEEIRKAREVAQAEGEAKGLAEGEAKGLVEGKAEGLAEGKAEGLAEGLEKKSKEIAILLLKQGQLSIESISSVTGLSIEELQELQKVH